MSGVQCSHSTVSQFRCETAQRDQLTVAVEQAGRIRILLGNALFEALGLICGDRRKYMYPIVPALLFLPTVPVYYNESALVHALWHMAAAVMGLMVGSGVRTVWKLCWKK